MTAFLAEYALHDHATFLSGAALDTVLNRYPAVSGQTWISIENPGLLVKVRRTSTTPISSYKTPDGLTLLLGTCWLENALQCSTADELHKVGSKSPDRLSGLNGFYTVLMQRSSGTLCVAADLLGYFPVYWWADSDCLLLASHVGHLVAHPRVQRQIDPLGLTGLLYAGHMLGERTLWKGIQRLPANTTLIATSKGVRLTPGPDRLRFSGAPPAELKVSDTQGFDEAMARAIKRSVNASLGRRLAFSLSGGLDSRLVAGYLAEEVADVQGFTFGKWADYEVNAARLVCRALRWPHHLLRDDHSAYVQGLHSQIEEHAANSMVDLSWWRGANFLSQLEVPVITGLVGDPIAGASHAFRGWSPGSNAPDFDKANYELSRQGLGITTIRALLGEDTTRHTLVELENALRQIWNTPSIPACYRSWWFDLQTRQRFHTAPIAMRLAAGSWCFSPYTDTDVIQSVIQFHPLTIAKRALQKSVLIHRFPALAAVELDRSSFNDTPLLDNARARWRARWRPWFLRNLLARIGIEHITYKRILDFNGPAWKTLRKQVSPIEIPYLNHETLQAIWPSPEQNWRHSEDPDITTRSTAYKMLLQLALIEQNETRSSM